MHFELVNVQIGHPRYEELVGQIRTDAALRQRMWLEAEHRFEELPGKVWSFVVVNVRGRWVPAAWAAARPVDGVLVCSDNYERPGFRGPDLGRIGWGLYPEAYRWRHITMVLPLGLPARTFIFGQPRELHERDGWQVIRSGTSHQVAEPHDWWELDRPPIRWETVGAERLHEHTGRLVAMEQGRLYEILAVGPSVEGERAVTVPAELGRTTQVSVLDEGEFSVRDAPTSPAARTYLISRGHRLEAPAS
jgi:hypothetical protein